MVAASRSRQRHGLTLVELMLVVTIIGLVTLIAIRQTQLYLDRVAARNAVAEAASVVERARDEAAAHRTVVSLRIDTMSATLLLRAPGAAPTRYPLGQAHGVVLSTTRDSIAFDVRGLGYGAANLTLVARRGAAADTLVVSRLGRTRY
jgi:prepilin-type N-terminal cleavage/methylation domain-containing protein